MPSVDLDKRSPRLLIVRRSALGDIVMSLPALVALRRKYPEAYLAWVVERRYSDALVGHECLDELFIIPERPYSRPDLIVSDNLGQWGPLHQRRFDLALDLQCRNKSWLNAWVSGAPRRVGTSFTPGGRLGWPWLNEFVHCPRQTHAVDRLYPIMEHLGVELDPLEYRYPVLPEARTWAREFLAERGLAERPVVGLVLGAGFATKVWPPEHFAALAKLLREREGVEVLLLGGPKEGHLEAAVQTLLPEPAPSAVQRSNLQQLAALLERMAGVVSGDTGAMHISAALGRPLVALFGATSPLITGPVGGSLRVLWDNPACGPCKRRPSCRDLRCMREITPERVVEALRELGPALGTVAAEESPA